MLATHGVAKTGRVSPVAGVKVSIRDRLASHWHMQAFMRSVRLRPGRTPGYLCLHEQDRRSADAPEVLSPNTTYPARALVCTSPNVVGHCGKDTDGRVAAARLSLPSLPFYAACRPDEATVSMRRAHAFILARPMPPVENAGLCTGLHGLGERVTASQGLREDRQHGVAVVISIVATAGQCSLDEDAGDCPRKAVTRSTFC